MGRRDGWLGWLMVLPAALVLGTFHVFPVLYLVWMSLFKWGFTAEKFLGLGNYVALLHDREFGLAMLQTVYYVIGTVPVEVALGLLIATLLFRRIAGRDLYRLVYFLPYVTSTVAAAVVWGWIFSPGAGFANFLFGAIGLKPQRWMLESTGVVALMLGHFGVAVPAWLAGPSLALVGIIIFSIWYGVGVQVVLFLAGLSAVPPEVYEAARTDGAGSWQTLRWITLPLLRPTIAFVAIVTTIFAFRAFNQFYVMTQPHPGDPIGTTTVATIFIFNAFYSRTQLGYASAAALILFLVLLGLSTLQLRWSRGWA